MEWSNSCSRSNRSCWTHPLRSFTSKPFEGMAKARRPRRPALRRPAVSYCRKEDVRGSSLFQSIYHECERCPMTMGKALFAVVSLSCFGLNCYAQVPAAAPRLPRYPEIKAHFDDSLSKVSTDEARWDLYRLAVAHGRHSGVPMLMRMFGNFEPGSFKLSASTPGLSAAVRLLASDNRNVAKGSAADFAVCGQPAKGWPLPCGWPEPPAPKFGRSDGRRHRLPP